MSRRLPRTYWIARRVLVITATPLIAVGLARLCIDSWAAVNQAPALTFDLLVGAAAATGACVIAAWVALVVMVIAVSALPGRLGVAATRVSRVIAPVATRRRAQVALGLAVTAAQVGLVVAPATAADPPAGRTSSVTSTSTSTTATGVEDLPPIGRPPVPPPSVVIPAPESPPESTLPSPEVDPKPDRHKHVTVEPGDTLWAIAAEHLDDPTPAAVAGAWPLWFAVNRDVIGPDPDHIRPGMVLAVPPRSADPAMRTDR